MFKIFSGIDEAALGPVLGPYCCALTSFRVTNEDELFDIFQELTDIKIGDSKKLYTSGKSIRELENTALSFYKCFFNKEPETVKDLLSDLIIDNKNIDELCAKPWYESIKSRTLPIVCKKEKLQQNSEMIRAFLEEKGLEIKGIKMDIVSAERFNRILSEGLNKSQCCQQFLTPLLIESQYGKSRLTVDRQGGRKYYGEWLIDTFPGSRISINRETQDLSSYTVEDSTIQFQVKGDDKFLETSLASIFSKYVRELMMISFNNYWREKYPGIKGTAGYPQDGKRFLKDLQSKGATYEEQMLIRQK